MKLQVIELKEIEVVDLGNGEFESRVVGTERAPLMFSNRALQLAKREGILETGLEEELFNLYAVMGQATNGRTLKKDAVDIQGEDLLKVSSIISLDHMKDLIWCAYVGAKTGSNVYYSRDEFKDLYDEDFGETLLVFVELVSSSVQRDENKFASNLKRFEGKKEKGSKK